MGAADGRPNGSVKVKTEPNGHPAGATLSTIRRAQPPKRSWSAWLLNNFARLAVWYTIITVLFRCPTDPQSITDTSPRICKSYFTARDYVQPHVQPYYDTYAGPYVDKVRPYADQINGKIIGPATVLTTRNYQKFAAPQIEKARQAGSAQWQKSVVPQIQVAQARAAKLYDANIAPHVDKVFALTSPYYTQARGAAETVHKNHVLPALDFARPVVQNGLATSQKFLTGTAYPVARHGWSTTVIFVDGTLWPFLKGLYSDNVRPQLVMISERIAKYQESRKLQAIIENAEPSAELSSTSSETLTTATNVAESATGTPSAAITDSEFDKIFEEEDESAAEIKTVERKKQPNERVTDESITADLRNWQTKFALAADKGTEDLRERAAELAADLAKTDIEGLGKGLETALRKTIETELDTVKAKIIAAVSALPEEDSSDAEKAAAEDIMKKIRSSGLEIKERAKKVRDWSQKFESDIDMRIARAASSTLEVLDGIRDIGLQEIGMRWAWMDGVTYKHWAKYHELKKQLTDWRAEVRAVATDIPEAVQAKATATQILEECMALTEDAAKELVKLKEVAKWKIRAHDATEDFELRVMPAAAASIASEFAASSASLFDEGAGAIVSSAVSGASGAIGGAVSSASSVVATPDSIWEQIKEDSDEFSDTASSIVASPSEPGSIWEQIKDQAGEVFESGSSAVSSPSQPGSIWEQIQDDAEDAYEGFTRTVVEMGTATETISLSAVSDASSAASAAFESASSVVLGSLNPAEAAALSASSAVLGSSGPAEKFTLSASSAASEASDAVEEVASSASSVILGTSGTAEQVSSVASEAVNGVSDSVSAAASAASDYAEEAKGSVKSAASKGSSFIPGAMAQEVKGSFPIYDDFFDDSETASYSQKLQDMVNDAGANYAELTSAVSEAVFGKTKGSVESATSVAAAQYSQALAAASKVLFPPSQGTAESIASVITDRYNDAVSAARAALSSTPTPTLEAMLNSMVSRANAAYDMAVSGAKERYEEGMSIASDQVIGTTKPVHERMFLAIQSA